MLKNKVIDRYLQCIMQKLRIISQVYIYSLADPMNVLGLKIGIKRERGHSSTNAPPKKRRKAFDTERTRDNFLIHNGICCTNLNYLLCHIYLCALMSRYMLCIIPFKDTMNL